MNGRMRLGRWADKSGVVHNVTIYIPGTRYCWGTEEGDCWTDSGSFFDHGVSPKDLVCCVDDIPAPAMTLEQAQKALELMRAQWNATSRFLEAEKGVVAQLEKSVSEMEQAIIGYERRIEAMGKESDGVGSQGPIPD